MPSDRCHSCGTIISEIVEQHGNNQNRRVRKLSVKAAERNLGNYDSRTANHKASKRFEILTKRKEKIFPFAKKDSLDSSSPSPACVECAEWATEYRQKQNEAGNNWIIQAEKVEQSLKTTIQSSNSAESILNQSRCIENVMKELTDATKVLKVLSRESKEVQSVLANLRREEDEIAKEEFELFYKQLDWVINESKFQEGRDSLLTQIDFVNTQLAALAPVPGQSRLAFNDAFHIWHQGLYGTINGLRLGHLPVQSDSAVATRESSQDASGKRAQGVGRRTDAQGQRSGGRASEVEGEDATPAVSWEEVNNAFGQAAMLLVSIANNVGFEFKEFNVFPNGSRSYLVKNKNPSESYVLCFDEDQQGYFLEHILKGIRGSNSSALDVFNRAVTSFVICLKELEDYATTSELGKRLDLKGNMYPIKVSAPIVAGTNNPHVTIDGLPVVLENALDHKMALNWTITMRSMLSNLKWLLVWCVKQK